MAEWQGPAAGLAVLNGFEPPTWLAGSYLWAAVLGDLHRRWGTEGTLFSGYDSARLKRHLEVVKSSGRTAVDLDASGRLNKNDHFLECLRSGSEPLVTAVDARNATAVVTAAYASMRSGEKASVDWREA